MTIEPGKYLNRSIDQSDHFVGTGPVPPVYPPFPSVLRAVKGLMKDAFEVTSKGTDKYGLKTHDLHAGYENDNVRLIPEGRAP
ncbi:hypothetical protein RSAG8_09549, partial [Rhizoctonia solani AG-8 WAC10335]